MSVMHSTGLDYALLLGSDQQLYLTTDFEKVPEIHIKSTDIFSKLRVNVNAIKS